MMTKEELQQFLDEEEAKIKKADQLYSKLFPTKFWHIFSLKHWKLWRGYRKVVESFNDLSDIIK